MAPNVKDLLDLITEEVQTPCSVRVQGVSEKLQLTVLNRREYTHEYTEKQAVAWDEDLNLSVLAQNFEQGVEALWLRTIGWVGYEAYSKGVGGFNYRGEKLPWYFRLTPEVQSAWGQFSCCLLKGGTIKEAYYSYSVVASPLTLASKKLSGETGWPSEAWHLAGEAVLAKFAKTSFLKVGANA